MSINPNIHDTKFKASVIGLNKAEVYHYLYEVEVAYQEALEKVDRLANNNETLIKQNHDNMLRIYNLQAALTEATTVPMEAGEDSIEDETDDDATTVLTSSDVDEDFEDTTVLVQDEEVEEIEDASIETDEVEEVEDSILLEDEISETIEENDEIEDTTLLTDEIPEAIKDSATIPTIDEFNDDDVFFGEIEDNSNKAFRIGDGDDDGLTFV